MWGLTERDHRLFRAGFKLLAFAIIYTVPNMTVDRAYALVKDAWERWL